MFGLSVERSRQKNEKIFLGSGKKAIGYTRIVVFVDKGV